jgi:hypothetical protein
MRLRDRADQSVPHVNLETAVGPEAAPDMKAPAVGAAGVVAVWIFFIVLLRPSHLAGSPPSVAICCTLFQAGAVTTPLRVFTRDGKLSYGHHGCTRSVTFGPRFRLPLRTPWQANKTRSGSGRCPLRTTPEICGRIASKEGPVKSASYAHRYLRRASSVTTGTRQIPSLRPHVPAPW